MKYKIIILVLILILLLIFMFFKQKQIKGVVVFNKENSNRGANADKDIGENPSSVLSLNDNYNIDIIIAQYNENIDFLKDKPFSEHNIICYNKGPKTPKCPSCVKIETLPNVGKCDHTYLYHIIQNYNNLADITIFLPGSCLMNYTKKNKTYKVIEYAKKNKNSVFIGASYNDVYKDLYGFKLDKHLTANTENQKLNNNRSLKSCEIRPFGKWYNSLFGNLRTTMVDYTSIFAVSREHILQHPKSYYEKIISYIDDDISPECGHYIERAWVAIFSPVPAECLYNNSI